MLRFIGLIVASAALAGCADQSTPSTEQMPFNLTGAPTVEFSVPDMMCPEGCGADIKNILAKQPGAKDVLIDFEHKTAVVAVENDKFDSDAAIAALLDQQYPNSTLKGDALAEPQADGAAVQ
jgi:copper chaperone CopZ